MVEKSIPSFFRSRGMFYNNIDQKSRLHQRSVPVEKLGVPRMASASVGDTGLQPPPVAGEIGRSSLRRARNASPARMVLVLRASDPTTRFYPRNGLVVDLAKRPYVVVQKSHVRKRQQHKSTLQP
jgi:hypothetical protein